MLISLRPPLAVSIRQRLRHLHARFGGEEAIFSCKCLIAATLAYYIALRLALPKPFWAVMTSYIVANPLAGAVHSKAAFRLSGTVVGGIVAVLLIPNLRGAPELLCLALAAWLGLCIYMAVLDRTPRAYFFLLAGFTAMVIGFPIIDHPEQIFVTALARVQEIALGFLSAGLVHSLAFPRSVSDRMLGRIDVIVRDAEQWSLDMLSQAGEERLGRDRRRLAMDIAELHQLSIHLPFDTGHRRLRMRAVRALQDQLSSLVPLAVSVEDRFLELERADRLDGEVRGLLDDVRHWLRAGNDEDSERDRAGADRLAARGQALRADFAQASDWFDLVRFNLLTRLVELIRAHAHCRDLSRQLHAPSRAPVSDYIPPLLLSVIRRPLHRDHAIAARSGFVAMMTVLLGSLFWQVTAWHDGQAAVMIAAISCSLFAGFDQPVALLQKFFNGWLIATIAATFYAFVIMPQVTSFEMLMLAFAPYLLWGGTLLARPQSMLFGTGLLLGLLNTVGLESKYTDDFGIYINVALAQLIGTGFAVVMLRAFSTIGAGESAQRLIVATWRDIGASAGHVTGALSAWISLALDRIGLLAPRLMAADPSPDRKLFGALGDLRVGAALNRLQDRALPHAAGTASVVGRVAAGVTAHYGAQAKAGERRDAPASLLLAIDDGLALLMAAGGEEGREQRILALMTLRHSLYPEASVPVLRR